jgi:hypothetical protein
MPERRTAKFRGHEAEVDDTDRQNPKVTVDGDEVPVSVVDGKYGVAYLDPVDDLLVGVREYLRLLPERRD